MVQDDDIDLMIDLIQQHGFIVLDESEYTDNQELEKLIESQRKRIQYLLSDEK